MENTKEKILSAALELFSSAGYEGTSMQDIAARLGLTKAALYRHFPGKEALFDALIASVRAHYEQGFHRSDPPAPPATLGELQAMSLAQIRFTIEDETVIRMRRLFTLNQYRSPHIAALTDEYFRVGLERMYAAIFEGAAAQGLIRCEDPALLAMEYIAPIGELIRAADREPQRKEEIFARIERFIGQFFLTFGITQRHAENANAAGGNSV